MPTQYLFKPPAISRCDVAEDDALVRRQSQRHAECCADLAESCLKPHRLGVFDPAVLNVEAVEPLAVALLVPAHAVVETVHTHRPQRLQRIPKILLDLRPESLQAPVVDKIF